MMLNGLATELSGIVVSLNGILTGFCQLLALFVIAIGVTRALVIFIKDALFKSQATEAFQRGRLVMGYSFSLALSFLIGATILKTMISSRWDDIARLAAIIAVRTVLNYLLLQAISKATPEVEQISTAAET
ncbi:DUF1622 domain-containing protein [Limnospira fusiformis KN01]|uniref:DUF1622 domain-containing protein n=1 Tax=Limnospira TaxID=2596745 RepID=UPI001658B67B|nr:MULTISPECIES: DUF1622 domain-containing protein [Limnospira]MDT9199616.1 DUF1622 domain-containing protein [Limnospira sp. PMC 1042.18]MDY7053679.1 DUF1622 domain-containing protein [Limnospira fusiformis LS22]ULB47031.1 DUF1622 domain-containing protein [Limnospira fusiformis KN01]